MRVVEGLVGLNRGLDQLLDGRDVLAAVEVVRQLAHWKAGVGPLGIERTHSGGGAVGSAGGTHTDGRRKQSAADTSRRHRRPSVCQADLHGVWCQLVDDARCACVRRRCRVRHCSSSVGQFGESDSSPETTRAATEAVRQSHPLTTHRSSFAGPPCVSASCPVPAGQSACRSGRGSGVLLERHSERPLRPQTAHAPSRTQPGEGRHHTRTPRRLHRTTRTTVEQELADPSGRQCAGSLSAAISASWRGQGDSRTQTNEGRIRTTLYRTGSAPVPPAGWCSHRAARFPRRATAPTALFALHLVRRAPLVRPSQEGEGVE